MNRKLVEIIAGVLIGIFIILSYFKKDEKFENLALGEETQSYQGKDGVSLIHVMRLDSTEEPALIKGWEERGKKPVILILGNSQTHSINQLKPGDVVFSEIVHQFVKNHDDLNKYDVLCESMPNVNLQEVALCYAYWKEKLPVKAIVLPVFMDDLREDGIRDVFIQNIIRSGFQIADSSSLIITKINREVHQLAHASAVDGSKIEKITDKTPQDISEQYLNEYLESHSAIWSFRPNVRGNFYNTLYQLRNTVFHITPDTKRKMIAQRYNDNIAALRWLLQSCNQQKIKALVYIPPIRNDVEIPYFLDEYTSFKTQIKGLSEGNNCLFYNWESIVPGRYWGVKGGTSINGKPELDYMHFQYPGHRVLADSLINALPSLIAQ